MTDVKKFKTELVAEGGSCAIHVPFDAEQAFGQRGRIPVCGTINGVEYRSSIFRMGQPCHFMVVNRQLREACGVEAGTTVTVTMARDDAPRTIEAPADLAIVLKGDPKLQQAWDALSYTHRKKYIQAINEAKREDTRARRIDKTIAALKTRKTR